MKRLAVNQKLLASRLYTMKGQLKQNIFIMNMKVMTSAILDAVMLFMFCWRLFDV